MNSLEAIFDALAFDGLNIRDKQTLPKKDPRLADPKFCYDLRDVMGYLKGRPLAIGTMCSGTESPILALKLINKSLPSTHCASS
jgi:hypothetical protein